MGVFSLLVSCEDVALSGSMGEDGNGGRNASGSSASECGCGMDDGITLGAGRFGAAKSSCAICSSSQSDGRISTRVRAFDTNLLYSRHYTW
jgi:hypothetical protein